jgi:hypothetical protein
MRHQIITYAIIVVGLCAAAWYMWNRTESYRGVYSQLTRQDRVADYLPEDRLSEEVIISLYPGDDLREFFEEFFATYNLPMEYDGNREAASQIQYSGPLELGLEQLLEDNRIKPVLFSTGTLLMQMHRKYPPGYEKYRGTTHSLNIPEIALP